MRCRAAITLVGLVSLFACRAPSSELHHERWRAWLDSPGGELPFELEIRASGERLDAFVINGPERLPVTRVERDGDRLALFIEHYDSRIDATLGAEGHRLDGRWRRTGVGGATTGLEFHAVAEQGRRFGEAQAAPDAAALAAVAGRWAVDFAAEDDPAVAVFESGPDGTVRGTFLTTTGDYRYLAGSLDGDRLRLSCFDGAHAFLFDARLGEDGTLAGDFWSRDTWHDTWTARKDPTAALPDPFELTRWVGERALDELAFPDLDGHPRSLGDPAFGGRARIIEIFGSWCPNCYDATRLFVELDREYRGRGLAVLGLAFEMTGDFERDAAQLRLYATHHGIGYPLLVAGTSDKTAASKAFPLIDRVRSYPTTIFLHGDGRVRAVHQGFAGPATGPAHHELRQRFETLVQELLAEPGSAP